MSIPKMATTVQPEDNNNPFASITPEDEGNHSVSSPERLSFRGDTIQSTTTQQRWNGDPMDWESWPIGRAGPFISRAAMERATHLFDAFDSDRNERSRTEEKVFHVAEFSSTSQSEFNDIVISSE